MQIYLAVSAEKESSAAKFTTQLAHASYRISADGCLLRQKSAVQTRGGILMLSDEGSGHIQSPKQLISALLRECTAREFSGIAADFEGGFRAELFCFLQELEPCLTRRGLTLTVPEQYARVGRPMVLLSTALSGGNLTQHLQEASRIYGASRLALDLQRVRMDFALPCPSGEGTPLSGKELSVLTETLQPNIYSSGELSAKYFTYIKGRELHLVLFDDAETMAVKIRAGNRLGISTGFLMFPETEDILDRLFGKEK